MLVFCPFDPTRSAFTAGLAGDSGDTVALSCRTLYETVLPLYVCSMYAVCLYE